MEFVLLLVGVFGLLRRRIRLTKTRVVRGPATVAISVLFFVPAVVSVCLSHGADALTSGAAVDRIQTNETLILGLAVGCLIVGVIIAAFCSKYEPPASKAPKR